MHARLLLICSLHLLGISVQAQPRVVLVFRHAEESKKSGQHLSDRGYERARRLPLRISSVLNGIPVGALYAQKPKEEDSSERALETLTPTSGVLGIPVQLKYEKKEHRQLVKHLLNDRSLRGKAVIVSWGSGELAKIVNELGYEKVGHPKSDWPGPVFDRFWLMTFDDRGQMVRFADLAQQVLYGDADSSHDDVMEIPHFP